MPEACSVLLLTVGTGTRGREDETILEPFRKSLEAAGAGRNILLPSQETQPVAEKIEAAFPQFRMEIRPLPAPGDENNADRCFSHYDAVISELLASGVDPGSMIADITRGTKAMSAALLLAAAVRGVRRVRYLVGQQRNPSGMAEPGSELVSDIEPSFIFVRQTLQRAEEQLRAGNFRAAQQLLAPFMPERSRATHGYESEAALLHWAAGFWGAWDRFDHATARRLAARAPEAASPVHEDLLPAENRRDLLNTLAAPLPLPLGERVKHCRALAADLLANAERRLGEGRFEEVLVRIYRTLELITTYRLFSHGIEAENIRWKDDRVQQWLSQRQQAHGTSRPPRALGRKAASELLVFLEQRDPNSRGARIAAKLLNTASWLGVNDAELRNQSVLIHGLACSGAQVANRLPAILASLRDFFLSEHERNRALLEAARFPFIGLREAVPAERAPDQR
ncbi:MAG: hypothetical protein NZR01_08400 [Bryobacteraceae bacterium]|nr:hypothetical protein [Bryobacteraceae bacterium]